MFKTGRFCDPVHGLQFCLFGSSGGRFSAHGAPDGPPTTPGPTSLLPTSDDAWQHFLQNPGYNGTKASTVSNAFIERGSSEVHELWFYELGSPLN